MPNKTTAANLAATQAAKLAAASKAAEAIDKPEVHDDVLNGVVDKAGTNKTTRKPKPAAKAAPKPDAEAPAETPAPKPAPAKPAKPAKSSAPWHDLAAKPPTENEKARYAWTIKTAGLKAADLPLERYVLAARSQGYFQKAQKGN